MTHTYGLRLSRTRQHPVRHSMLAFQADSLEVEADCAATEIIAAEIACRWTAARYRAAWIAIDRTECRERALDASRPLKPHRMGKR